jgi:hypothetical protein
LRKKLSILIVIILVVLVILLKILSGDGSIKANMVDVDEASGKTQSSQLEIVYKNKLPHEMILEVSSDSEEIFDTTYSVVKSIVDTIKLKNNDDPITLTKEGLELELKANVESEGFTYPKDYTKEQMREYLKSQGWNVR